MEKIGNIKREKTVFKSRVILSAVIMLLITLILILRLFNLQVTKHDYYLEEALAIPINASILVASIEFEKSFFILLKKFNDFFD